jgi:hypothetical protein
MYRLLIKRDQDNPLTGRARYRVVDCWKQFNPSGPNIAINPNNSELGLTLPTSRRKGCFININKALFGAQL